MCPYTCRSTLYSKLLQLPTSRDREQESLTDAAQAYTTQQEEQGRWNGERQKKKKMTEKTPQSMSPEARQLARKPPPWTGGRRSSAARNQGKRPWDRARISLATSPGSLTLSRQACLHRHVASNRTELSLRPGRRGHAMISSGSATNRVRFWNTTQRLTKELNRQQKRRTESDFKTACRSAHVLADNDVLKILPGKQAK